MFQDDPESYNGARREHYRWAQSITDVDLRVNVRQTSSTVEAYYNTSHYDTSADIMLSCQYSHYKMNNKGI